MHSVYEKKTVCQRERERERERVKSVCVCERGWKVCVCVRGWKVCVCERVKSLCVREWVKSVRESGWKVCAREREIERVKIACVCERDREWKLRVCVREKVGEKCVREFEKYARPVSTYIGPRSSHTFTCTLTSLVSPLLQSRVSPGCKELKPTSGNTEGKGLVRRTSSLKYLVLHFQKQLIWTSKHKVNCIPL